MVTRPSCSRRLVVALGAVFAGAASGVLADSVGGDARMTMRDPDEIEALRDELMRQTLDHLTATPEGLKAAIDRYERLGEDDETTEVTAGTRATNHEWLLI